MPQQDKNQIAAQIVALSTGQTMPKFARKGAAKKKAKTKSKKS